MLIKSAVKICGRLAAALAAAVALGSGTVCFAQNPTWEQQRQQVDADWAEINKQVISYPDVPHLNPTLVAAAMANPAYKNFSFVIAHRGEHSEPQIAENAVTGVWRAYQSGADGIELDVKVTQDGVPVLGHDFAIGRELYSWPDKKGVWTTMLNFPAADFTYFDPDKWPFMMNNKPNDPANPNRLTNPLSLIYAQPVADQFELMVRTGGQMTLYQAMYAVGRYAPMMIWLDIKNVPDMETAAGAVDQIRKDFPDNPVYKTIGLKLGYSTLAATSVNFDPNVYLKGKGHTTGYVFFNVIGTGDLDAILGKGDKNAIYSQFKTTCSPSKGCLGPELAHKANGGPTLSLYNAAISDRASSGLQMAGFHTVPQYDWFTAMAHQINPTIYSATYGRWFPRTDGSCCFALTDALNVSDAFGPDVVDYRHSFAWNERTFSSITTDSPTQVLRDLFTAGKRPADLVTALGGNSTIPSGGKGHPFVRDGLYWIKWHDGQLPLAEYDLQPMLRPATAKESLFYVSAREQTGSLYSNPVTLVNAGTGLALAAYLGGDGKFALNWDTFPYSKNALWQIAEGPGGYNIWPNMTEPGNYLSATGPAAGALITFTSDFNAAWLMARANETLPESGTFAPVAPPAGMHFLCDDGATSYQCWAGPNTLVAYGTAAANVIKTTGPSESNISCSTAYFGKDPAPGQAKQCFAASATTTAGAFPSEFYKTTSIAPGVPIGQPGSTFFGAQLPSGGWVGYYYWSWSTDEKCELKTVARPSTLPNLNWGCHTRANPDPGLPAGFARCASHWKDCNFAGAHVVGGPFIMDPKTSTYGYTYKLFANGAPCTAAAFGLPEPSVSPGPCIAIAATANGVAGPDGYSWCGNDKGACSFAGTAYVAYGAAGAYVFKKLSGGTLCNATAFGRDPAPGQPKSCFYRLY